MVLYIVNEKLKFWKTFLYILNVFFGFGINYIIIKIDDYKYIKVWSKDIVHHKLKYGRAISLSKKYYDKLKFFVLSIESCFKDVFFLDLNILVP